MSMLLLNEEERMFIPVERTSFIYLHPAPNLTEYVIVITLGT